jgi:hypothetical protein
LSKSIEEIYDDALDKGDACPGCFGEDGLPKFGRHYPDDRCPFLKAHGSGIVEAIDWLGRNGYPEAAAKLEAHYFRDPQQPRTQRRTP